jgi:hypothetical protein
MHIDFGSRQVVNEHQAQHVHTNRMTTYQALLALFETLHYKINEVKYNDSFCVLMSKVYAYSTCCTVIHVCACVFVHEYWCVHTVVIAR